MAAASFAGALATAMQPRTPTPAPVKAPVTGAAAAGTDALATPEAGGAISESEAFVAALANAILPQPVNVSGATKTAAPPSNAPEAREAPGAQTGGSDDTTSLLAAVLATATQTGATPATGVTTEPSSRPARGGHRTHHAASGATSATSAAAATTDTADDATDSDAKAGVVSKASRKQNRHTTAETTSSDTTAVVRSLDALDPALQDKLARVMTRMHDETGMDVTVAETYRSQPRQDALYAQGRDTPGSVVTWTHNSQHTAGRAADLVLSGAPGANTTNAYNTLQRIANEEGLHTLGARDPGHVELPAKGHADDASDTSSLNAVEPADAQTAGQVPLARVAQLARVADVAAVAQPARVAQVAPAARAGIQAPETAPADATSSGGAASRLSIAVGTVGADRPLSGGGRDCRGQSGSGDSRYSAMAAAVALRDQAAGRGTGTFDVQDVSAATGTTAAERAARMIAAVEDAPARPLSQISVAVDAGNGATDRIQLSLRGTSLDATINAADPRAAQAMSGRADELARALTRDGIDLQSLHVRSATPDTTGSAAAALGGTTSSQTRSDSSNNPRSERGQAWTQQDRQRSQQERRNSQREQRGGQTR